MSEPLFRMVNGVRVQIPDNEAAQIRAEWANPSREPPPSISSRQIHLWLFRRGITEEMIEAQIAAIPDPVIRSEAQIEWRKSNTYDRHHPFVEMIGAALGFTSEQMDAEWREAATY